jgi:mannose-1-phosphate guanylyltransferase/mannose-6-phosphate isomerase
MACDNQSIDVAVMEKLTQASSPSLPQGVVLPLGAQWSDVGAWGALEDLFMGDASGNATQGDVQLAHAHNTLAIASSRLVVCVGTNDLVVVETPDAVLVVHKNSTQAVKAAVEQLNQQGRTEGNKHRKGYRPWGWYDTVDVGEQFQVKRLVVRPGGALSLQVHQHRAEHWVVVRGTAKVTKNGAVLWLTENESIDIPCGVTHRLENPGPQDLEIIEVQSGSYLGEDDIVRLDDLYGRSSRPAPPHGD